MTLPNEIWAFRTTYRDLWAVRPTEDATPYIRRVITKEEAREAWGVFDRIWNGGKTKETIRKLLEAHK